MTREEIEEIAALVERGEQRPLPKIMLAKLLRLAATYAEWGRPAVAFRRAQVEAWLIAESAEEKRRRDVAIDETPLLKSYGAKLNLRDVFGEWRKLLATTSNGRIVLYTPKRGLCGIACGVPESALTTAHPLPDMTLGAAMRIVEGAAEVALSKRSAPENRALLLKLYHAVRQRDANQIISVILIILTGCVIAYYLSRRVTDDPRSPQEAPRVGIEQARWTRSFADERGRVIARQLETDAMRTYIVPDGLANEIASRAFAHRAEHSHDGQVLKWTWEGRCSDGRLWTRSTDYPRLDIRNPIPAEFSFTSVQPGFASMQVAEFDESGAAKKTPRSTVSKEELLKERGGTEGAIPIQQLCP